LYNYTSLVLLSGIRFYIELNIPGNSERLDTIVRQDAAESLGIIRDKEGVEPLIQLLKDKDRFIRKVAILALEKIGDKRAIEPLTDTLKKEKDEFIKGYIERVLENLRS